MFGGRLGGVAAAAAMDDGMRAGNWLVCSTSCGAGDGIKHTAEEGVNLAGSVQHVAAGTGAGGDHGTGKT
jgi:hypothetical protein